MVRPREEHVVDEHDDGAVDAAARDVGGLERAGGSQPQVVAVHRDVERRRRDLDALDLGHHGRRCGAASGDPAGRDAEQDDVVGALVALEDLVRDAGQRAGDVRRGIAAPTR